MVRHSSQARVPACWRDGSERYGGVPRNPGHHSSSQIEAGRARTPPLMSVRGEQSAARSSPPLATCLVRCNSARQLKDDPGIRPFFEPEQSGNHDGYCSRDLKDAWKLLLIAEARAFP